MQIPKAFELVGLVYSAWFTYRYLLYKVRSHSAWHAVPDQSANFHQKPRISTLL